MKREREGPRAGVRREGRDQNPVEVGRGRARFPRYIQVRVGLEVGSCPKLEPVEGCGRGADMPSVLY